MRGIAIYLEGGGQSRGTRQRLRVGMSHFLGQLKERACRKSMFWKIVACGGRDGAFHDWTKQPLNPRTPIRILLVDAEGSVFVGGGWCWRVLVARLTGVGRLRIPPLRRTTPVGTAPPGETPMIGWSCTPRPRESLVRHSRWQGPASSAPVSRSRAMPTGGRRSKPSPRFFSVGDTRLRPPSAS